jgi:transcriptional regulator GlxA family with amidase domain
MISSVAVLAYEGVSAFGLGVTSEVFGCDRSGEGLPRYDYAVTAREPGLIQTDTGPPILVTDGLDRLRAADLAVVVCWDTPDTTPPPEVLNALRTVIARGGRVLSQCTGAFVLAAAGLLDGRRATTHWRYADQLAARYPAVKVDRDVLYVDEGEVVTSAGTAAGIDACLHVLRLEHGAAVANSVARHMVVAPHRDGGQSQFVPVPVDEGADLTILHDWALTRLNQPMTVTDMARQVQMAPRTFARWFGTRTGTTPHQWLTGQRLIRAQELLERTDHGIEQIAAESGLTPVMLRRHFSRRLGISPQSYRRRFSQLPVPGRPVPGELSSAGEAQSGYRGHPGGESHRRPAQRGRRLDERGARPPGRQGGRHRGGCRGAAPGRRHLLPLRARRCGPAGRGRRRMGGDVAGHRRSARQRDVRAARG